MSVRVNLLPQEQSKRQAAARQRNGVVAGGVVLVAALGIVYWWANGQVADAEDRLELAQAETSILRADVTALGEFRELADRRDASVDLLSTVLAGEVSFAGLMQDLAAVMPADGQLEAVSADIAPVAEGDAGTVGTSPGSVGSLNLTGKTLNAHAPGVERYLLELDKVASLRDLYVNSSALDDPEGDVATFNIDAGIGPEALTGRYLLGLPEELR